MRCLVAIAAAALIATSAAASQAPQLAEEYDYIPPTTEIVSQGATSFMLCGRYYSAAMEQRGSWQGSELCVEQAQARMSLLYDAASKHLARRPAAMAILRDYYAAWLAAMQALPPTRPESAAGYHRRQSANGDDLTRLGERLKLEK